MYVWHKLLVAEDLERGGRVYSLVHARAGGCFRSFPGSGVVAIEAVRHKRRAIVCDLNPAASRITELTLRPVNLLSLQQAFERVAERTCHRIEKLYEAHCLKCGKPLMASCFVRRGEDLTEVRYPSCPSCEHRCETGCAPRKADVERLVELEKKSIKVWHPKNRLYYPDGAPFKKKEQYNSLDELFTRRNLLAAAGCAKRFKRRAVRSCGSS